jgi:hypothetical protein
MAVSKRRLLFRGDSSASSWSAARSISTSLGAPADGAPGEGERGSGWNGTSEQRASGNWGLVLRAAAISAPVIIFAAIPNPVVEASLGNPLGFLTSNFVYDGSTNIENIVLSSVFLLIVGLYLPGRLRVFMLWLLPFIAVVAGGLAELTTIASPYLSLPLCAQSCSFYGMSAVSNAMIGFSCGSFFLAYRLTYSERPNSATGPGGSHVRTLLRSRAFLTSSFVIYVLLLLIFVGAFALTSAPTSTANSTSSSSAPSPPPPTLYTQPPPTAAVHSVSLVYGFLFCLATFVLVNRRYRVTRRAGD